jgi:hypothetical protein
VRSELHYLEFNMVVWVQGWRKKWFYIKDQKAMSSNKFGIAPFDASKNLTKLTSWDSPPTEAEVEGIKPLLTRIQSLKSATWRWTDRDATDGVLPSEAHPTSVISSFKAMVLLWLGRSFSSVRSGPREKRARQKGMIFDYSYCTEWNPSVDSCFLRLRSPLARGMRLISRQYWLLFSILLCCTLFCWYFSCDCSFVGPSSFGFSSSSSRGRANLGWSCSCYF